MFKKISQIFKIKDLRKRLFFVLCAMGVFRLMANIPAPGLGEFANKQMGAGILGDEAFGFLDLLTGGALDQVSLVMLGLGPYITATIVFQLLTIIIPQLEEIQKEEGQAGRQKINQYARFATIPLSIAQSYAMLKLFGITLHGLELVAAMSAIAAGSIFLMWLGELITEKGIGEGVSLLIFAGILARVPISIGQNLFMFQNDMTADRITGLLIFLLVALFLVVAVVLVNEAKRNIPVSYAKQIRGNKVYGGATTYLPLSINPTGVIPIIFAISFMMIPNILANVLKGQEGIGGDISSFLLNSLNMQSWGYNVFYFFLVFAFTFLYASIVFKPQEIADNLQRMGGFIPGVRPGQKTATFLKEVLNRLLFIGALFLSIIALTPNMVAIITNVQGLSFMVGGTSLLIVVSVILDTVKKINAQLQMRNYDTI